MPLEDWIPHSRVDQFLYDWQTVIAGGLALLAGVLTVVAAIWAIWATREQTATIVRLEQERDASEARAFHVMLEAAMARVLAEADWARKTYPQFFPEDAAGLSSIDAFAVRNCITKGAFAELRAACVRQGGPLTSEFLDLEREIDSFALQYEPTRSPIRMGKHAGLGDQLASIETKATKLRQQAAERI